MLLNLRSEQLFLPQYFHNLIFWKSLILLVFFNFLHNAKWVLLDG